MRLWGKTGQNMYVRFPCLNPPLKVLCVVDSWLSEVKQTADRHRRQLGWRTSPCKEVGGFWLLLRQRYCPGHLGAAKVSLIQRRFCDILVWTIPTARWSWSRLLLPLLGAFSVTGQILSEIAVRSVFSRCNMHTQYGGAKNLGNSCVQSCLSEPLELLSSSQRS